MNKKEAVKITGGLSAPTKMPCPAYNLPATSCKTGSKLRKKSGTVCSKCYGCKGRYVFPNVKNAQSLRLKSITHPQWIDAMTLLIKRSDNKYFRWHDSGDIQSIDHLRKIINIARRLPQVQFWLPTKEIKLIQLARKKGLRIPKNLCIRHSEQFIGSPPTGPLTQVLTSTVASSSGFKCPVKEGTKTCDDYKCRKCWDKTVKNIDYHFH